MLELGAAECLLAKQGELCGVSVVKIDLLSVDSAMLSF